MKKKWYVVMLLAATVALSAACTTESSPGPVAPTLQVGVYQGVYNVDYGGVLPDISYNGPIDTLNNTTVFTSIDGSATGPVQSVTIVYGPSQAAAQAKFTPLGVTLQGELHEGYPGAPAGFWVGVTTP